MDIVAQTWARCKRCSLYEFRRKVVVGEGPCPADVMFIGEGPGRTEDATGRPFTGAAGGLLRRAVKDALVLSGVCDSPSIYYTNMVACRPCDSPTGENRAPKQDEVEACKPRLLKLYDIVSPKIVILLGEEPAKHYQKIFPNAVKLRHPAYLLRTGGVFAVEYKMFLKGIADAFRVIAGAYRLFEE